MLFHGSEFVVQPEYAALFQTSGVQDVEDAFRVWCPDPPGHRRSRVVEIHAPRHFFFKAYDYRGLWRLRTLFIPARVKREFRNLIGLSALGLRVPRPIAYGQTRRFGFILRSFLMTEAVAGAIDLREVADGKPAPFPLPRPAERRSLIATFARQLRRCHDAGWFLHTAFFKNLLLTRGADGYALHVIDVPFARIWRNRLLPGQARVRDLGCLLQGARQILTGAERLRFYRMYAAVERLTQADKTFLRRVERYQRRHYP
ncbi:MAG: hypothetical protein HYY16_16760 [Planctomycetes bacterium]|nr:hypothetical protein [Planctomycetota bacterium]